MSTVTYLSNPVVTINNIVLTDQTTAATFTHRFDQLEATAFGDTARKYVKGLGNHEITLSMYMSYATGETYATLSSLVGTTTTVRVQPTADADGATNPGFILTGAFLAELPVINATMGELSTVDVTFVGGVYSVDTTPTPP
jgi:hypothetical protein